MNSQDFTSTDLISYCNYIRTWEDESDGNIDKIIAEHRALRAVPNDDPTAAVSDVIGDIESSAGTLVEEIIAEEATEIVADAAAIAAFWSFGASLAVLALAEAAAIADGLTIASTSKELNEKMEKADVNISGKINSELKDYITKWKDNNLLIAGKATKGLDTRHCRTILFQFMLHVECKETLTASSFKKWAGVVRRFYDSEEIQGVLDALDDLYLSDKSDKAVQDYWKKFKQSVPSSSLSYEFARDLSIIALNLSTQGGRTKIEKTAKEEGIEVEEVEMGLWEAMTGIGKFFTVIAVGWALIDAFLDVLKIIDMLKRYKELKRQLELDFKSFYINFYKGVADAAETYRKIHIKE